MSESLMLWLGRIGTVLEVYGIWVAISDYLNVPEVNFMVGPVKWVLTSSGIGQLRRGLAVAGLVVSLLGVLLQLMISFF
jgi:hypothetical protein